MDKEAKGPGFWKMNTSILDNLNAAKDKLESFYDEKVNGIIIRA